MKINVERDEQPGKGVWMAGITLNFLSNVNFVQCSPGGRAEVLAVAALTLQLL